MSPTRPPALHREPILALPGLHAAERWEDLWSGVDTPEATGAVFTKAPIVDLILDLAGYTVGPRRLATRRVLEPSCGDGAFVTRVVDRLIASERAHAAADRRAVDWSDATLDAALRATDINRSALALARDMVTGRLTAAGCPNDRACSLAETWILSADFLLHEWDRHERFHLVVGNPPYVRVEALPKAVLARYRQRYATMSARADVYVAFIERGLELLAPDGTLAYIVANRWVKNAYGRTLRALIAQHYHVAHYLDLAHTQPFDADVSAYPAIVVLDRRRGEPTHAATLDDINPESLGRVRELAHAFPVWYPDGAPWVATSPTDRADLHRLATLPTLEASAPGTKVGIGVATGADKVFITRGMPPGVEPDRLIPLAMPGDVRNIGIDWSGHFILNPFAPEDDGALIDLARYPGVAEYLERHSAALRARHVARSRPRQWYRTIDRIWPSLRHRPKLLMRDIQDPGKPTIGFDDGRPGHYPHHNLYFVTSEAWPLGALQCLLRSAQVVQQIRAHSVVMRGGSIRWQAQSLRRVRVPRLQDVPGALLDQLTAAGGGTNQEQIDAVAAEVYGFQASSV